MLDHHNINVGDTVSIKTYNCKRSIKQGIVTWFDGDWLAVDSRTGAMKMTQVEKIETFNIAGWSIQAKRDLLDLNGGRFFSLMWIKKDGSIRQATCKHWQHDMFALGHKELAQANTVAQRREYYTAVDLDKGGWINIDLNTLFYIKINGITYVDFNSEQGKALNLENS